MFHITQSLYSQRYLGVKMELLKCTEASGKSKCQNVFRTIWVVGAVEHFLSFLVFNNLNRRCSASPTSLLLWHMEPKSFQLDLQLGHLGSKQNPLCGAGAAEHQSTLQQMSPWQRESPDPQIPVLCG